MSNQTNYHLHIYQLICPYTDQESLKQSTQLQSYESSKPFPAYHVGETIAEGAAMTYLGRIQHIHHFIGQTTNAELIAVTSLYLEPER